MNTQDIILLFSKYSPQCSKLLKKTQNFPEIRTIPVDNKNIRKRILKDTQLNITIVPSMLVINATGIIEKYEGMKAFEWIDEYSNFKNQESSNVSFIEPFQHPKQQPQQQQHIPQQQQQQQQQQQPQQPQQQPQQQQLQQQPQPQPHQPQQQPQQIPQPMSEINVSNTLTNQTSKNLLQNRYQQQQQQNQDIKNNKTNIASLKFEAESPPPPAIRTKKSLMEQAELMKRGREESFKNNSK